MRSRWIWSSALKLGYEALSNGESCALLPDLEAEQEACFGDDESGEDYLYPAGMFYKWSCRRVRQAVFERPKEEGPLQSAAERHASPHLVTREDLKRAISF